MYEAKTLGGRVCAYGTGESRGGAVAARRQPDPGMTQLRTALGLAEPGEPARGCGHLVRRASSRRSTSPAARSSEPRPWSAGSTPTWGCSGPWQFLDEAERHGLMGHLTHRVLDDALAAAASWRRSAGRRCGWR